MQTSTAIATQKPTAIAAAGTQLGSSRARSTAHRPETRRTAGISRLGREGISYPYGGPAAERRALAGRRQARAVPRGDPQRDRSVAQGRERGAC